uniref:Uncharacterized protein n=1 Tax=Rhizophora mucronata TaxID=61149 RepID=A0A2P2QSR6_RHIMU
MNESRFLSDDPPLPIAARQSSPSSFPLFLISLTSLFSGSIKFRTSFAISWLVTRFSPTPLFTLHPIFQSSTINLLFGT